MGSPKSFLIHEVYAPLERRISNWAAIRAPASYVIGVFMQKNEEECAYYNANNTLSLQIHHGDDNNEFNT